MFKPKEPKSLKYLSTFQRSPKTDTRSLDISDVLPDDAPGLVRIRWETRQEGSQSARGVVTESGEGTARKIADQFLAENRAH